MKTIHRLALVAALLAPAGMAAAAGNYCVYDSGYGETETCFTTMPQARQFLYSNAKGAKALEDADSTYFKPIGAYVRTVPGGFEKGYLYRYRNVAPTIDLGEWVVSWPANCGETNPAHTGGCLTPEAALEAGRAFWQQNITEPLPPYELSQHFEENTFEIKESVYYGTQYKGRITKNLYHEIWYPQGSTYHQISFGVTHDWLCPGTHFATDAPSFGQMCVGGVRGYISANNVPVKLASGCVRGNPCHPQSGLKTQPETDFEWDGLTFIRTYHSSDEAPFSAQFGPQWVHSLDMELKQNSDDEYMSRIGDKIEIYRRPAGATFYYSVNSPGARIRRGISGLAELDLPDDKVISFHNIAPDLFPSYRPTEIYDRAANQRYALEYCSDVADANCATGQLREVASSSGRRLDFLYADIFDQSGSDLGRRVTAIATDGVVFATYGYDAVGRLAAVSYPAPSGSSIRTYGYNEPGKFCVTSAGNPITPCYLDNNIALLTSIRDENGIAYASFKYDSLGRVVTSEHFGGADKVTLSYPSDFTSTVTDALGVVTTYTSQVKSAFYKLSGASSGGKTISSTFDPNGYLDNVIDKLGVVTDYDHDQFGRLVNVVRAKGTPQQQTESTQWNEASNKPAVTTVAGRQTVRSYNSRSQLLTLTETDTSAVPSTSRTTAYAYCEQQQIDAAQCTRLGALLAIDGARTDVSDVTSLSYYGEDDPQCAATPATCRYRKGDLWKVVNSLGHTFELLAYDPTGRAISTRDANAIVHDTEYSPRGWVTARKARGLDNTGELDDSVTRFEYDGVGQLTRLILPDGYSTRFTYDNAHRLTDITDALGNNIHFTLDYAGNRTKEETHDSAGTLKRLLSRVYNTLGQLQSLKDANLAATGFTYDANGAVDNTTDPLGRVTDSNFDPLGRLSQIIANVNRKAVDQAASAFQYDLRGNISAVIDPKGLTTGYGYNGFDDLVQLSSPDTGVTSFSYDLAGNRLSQLDARGIPSLFSYDALNRLTNQVVPTAAQAVSYDFDAPTPDCQVGETFGVGRLAKMSDESGSTRYCYDPSGNLVRKVQGVAGGSTLTTAATYSAAGRLIAMTYPSGAIVTYLRDVNGQIERIDASPSPGSSPIEIVSNVAYLPFGPLASMTFGNGRILTRVFDKNYGIDLVSDSAASGVRQDFSLNAAGNLTGLTERTSATATVSRSFVYDGLDRLTTQKNGSAIVEGFKYDATGNRTSKTIGTATTAYSYPGTSHRLSSIGSASRVYDAGGNTTQIGTGIAAQGFVLDDRGRLRDFKVGTTVKASYRYNGKGERVLRIDPVNAINSQQFVFDEAGRLLGEYTAAGSRLKEYVWLDDTLVAILSEHDGSGYQFVETDHLGTPRAVVHPSRNTIIWRWDLNNTAFGEHLPNGNPDGDSFTYLLNLRFPGQYFNAESGLYYNDFREYDPTSGRYTQSDPIGLNGGISTYGYVAGNPLGRSDKYGLDWIEYTGTELSLYGGKYGDRSRVVRQCRSSSGRNVRGYFDYRNSAYQYEADYGPTPEGRYSINLVPNPSRIAPVSASGQLTPSSRGGIERIPEGGEQIWGTWRAALRPSPATNTRGRRNMYLHDSTKGETSGCIETCTNLMDNLVQLRSSGVKAIDVLVDYPGNVSTNAGF